MWVEGARALGCDSSLAFRVRIHWYICAARRAVLSGADSWLECKHRRARRRVKVPVVTSSSSLSRVVVGVASSSSLSRVVALK